MDASRGQLLAPPRERRVLFGRGSARTNEREDAGRAINLEAGVTTPVYIVDTTDSSARNPDKSLFARRAGV